LALADADPAVLRSRLGLGDGGGRHQRPPEPAWRALDAAEPLPFIDPSQEGLAVQRNVRSGITSLPEAIRERGYDPDELLDEIAAFNKKLDDLGIVLDTDPRKMSQAGQQQSADNGGAQ
jgi:capsid protein